MMRKMVGWVLVAGIWSAAVLAQNSAGDAVDQRRGLLEQKLRLVETLMNSAATKAAGAQDAEAVTVVEKGRQMIDSARLAISAGQYDQATKVLDEALKSAAKPVRASGDAGGASESMQKAQLRELESQVTSYRNSVDELVRSGKGGGVGQVLIDQIDLKLGDARRHEAAGRLGDAHRKLSEAYRQVIQELSAMRAGQTVTQSLKFDSPADEYAYEQRRYASNELLVDMMVTDRGNPESRKLVETQLVEARRLRGEADKQASSGNHKAAVTTMEQSVTQLNRALQMLGVPVF